MRPQILLTRNKEGHSRQGPARPRVVHWEQKAPIHRSGALCERHASRRNRLAQSKEEPAQLRLIVRTLCAYDGEHFPQAGILQLHWLNDSQGWFNQRRERMGLQGNVCFARVSGRAAPASIDIVHTAAETVSNDGVREGQGLRKVYGVPGHVVLLLIAKYSRQPEFGSRKY